MAPGGVDWRSPDAFLLLARPYHGRKKRYPVRAARPARSPAETLGLSCWQIFRFVAFPQAIRTILPALGNQFVYALRMSSLVSVIGLQELTRRTYELNVSEYRPLEIHTLMVLGYLALILVASWVVRRLERRLATSVRQIHLRPI